MPQKDRHPGAREEDELFLKPGADAPSQNGEMTYVSGTGFRFYEEGTEKGLTGTGMSEAQHKSLDTLLHALSEDCYEEVTWSSNKVTNVIYWDSASKITKIREVALTRSAGKVSQIDLIQYNASGVENVRMTGVVARSSGRVSSITWTET